MVVGYARTSMIEQEAGFEAQAAQGRWLREGVLGASLGSSGDERAARGRAGLRARG